MTLSNKSPGLKKSKSNFLSKCKKKDAKNNSTAVKHREGGIQSLYCSQWDGELFMVEGRMDSI